VSLRLKEIIEREILVLSLADSLDSLPLTDVDKAWIEEAEKRYHNFKAGVTEGIPEDHFFEKIRQELGWQK